MKSYAIGIAAVLAAAVFHFASGFAEDRPPRVDPGSVIKFGVEPRAGNRLKVASRAPASSKEDCVSFSNRNARLERVNGSWKIVDGDHWIADFGDKSGEAKEAFRIVKFYGFDRQCFIGRPGPSMTYWKRGDTIPARDMEGQDCTSFDPGTVEVKRIDGRWKIVEGGHWIADFGSNRKEAFEAYGIVKRYKLSKQCFVGRPGPSMTYWLS